MQTSVVKEILDHSISGNKIYGGTIDYLEEINADAGIFEDITASSGTLNEVSIINSPSIIAKASGSNVFINVKNSSGTLINEYGEINNIGIITLRNLTVSPSLQTRISLNASTASHGFFLDKVIFGSSTSVKSSDYSIEISAPKKGFIETLESSYIQVTQANILLLYFGAGILIDDFYTDFNSVKDIVYAMPMDALMDLKTANPGENPIIQISAIGDSIEITNGKWVYLSTMDQSVRTDDDVNFASVSAEGTISANDIISTDGYTERERSKELGDTYYDDQSLHPADPDHYPIGITDTNKVKILNISGGGSITAVPTCRTTFSVIGKTVFYNMDMKLTISGTVTGFSLYITGESLSPEDIGIIDGSLNLHSPQKCLKYSIGGSVFTDMICEIYVMFSSVYGINIKGSVLTGEYIRVSGFYFTS